MSLITIKATAKHTSTVLLMHGLGDSGHGWQPFVEEVKSQVPHITWLLPSAPLLKVTLNNGYKMPAWYDIKSLGSGGRNQDKVLKF